MYVPRELGFQLNDSGSETIICLSRLYPYVRMVRPNTKLKNVIVTNIKEYYPPRLKAVFEQFVEEKEGHRVTIGADEHWFQDVLNRAPATPPNVTSETRRHGGAALHRWNDRRTESRGDHAQERRRECVSVQGMGQQRAERTDRMRQSSRCRSITRTR